MKQFMFVWGFLGVILSLCNCAHDSSADKSINRDTLVQKVASEVTMTTSADEDTTTIATNPASTTVAGLKPYAIKKKSQGVNVGADFLVSDKLYLLKDKKVAVVTNHTAILSDGAHLVDVLTNTGVHVVKVFTPEHGFRGTADAGEKVANAKDEKTGLSLVSLYGNNKKPTPAQLAGVDVVVFDIQDVGTRHYTYISTLSYVMEACAESGIPVILCDRPNPNGWYVDGPMMQGEFTSFIGMHKVPIVHGMTIGEYAAMVNAEGWLKGGAKCVLTVVPCEGYRHEMRWEKTGLQWIPPSPNMGSPYAAYLYPILCWYEATPVSVGRGTENKAFTILGAPWFEGLKGKNITNETTLYGLKWKEITFTPRSIVGKSKTPPFQDIPCKGMEFVSQTEGKNLFLAGITLLEGWYQAYVQTGKTQPFFVAGVEKWTGYTNFKTQIMQDIPAEEIYQSWQKETDVFREKRKKYLLYP